MFLTEKKSDSINRELALTLGVFRHRNTRACLNILLAMPDGETRENAVSSLLKLYGMDEGLKLRAMNDPGINRCIDDWLEKQ